MWMSMAMFKGAVRPRFLLLKLRPAAEAEVMRRPKAFVRLLPCLELQAQGEDASEVLLRRAAIEGPAVLAG